MKPEKEISKLIKKYKAKERDCTELLKDATSSWERHYYEGEIIVYVEVIADLNNLLDDKKTNEEKNET